MCLSGIYYLVISIYQITLLSQLGGRYGKKIARWRQKYDGWKVALGLGRMSPRWGITSDCRGTSGVKTLYLRVGQKKRYCTYLKAFGIMSERFGLIQTLRVCRKWLLTCQYLKMVQRCLKYTAFLGKQQTYLENKNNRMCKSCNKCTQDSEALFQYLEHVRLIISKIELNYGT